MRYLRSNWNANIIRLPFNQDWALNDPDYLKFIDQVIDWANDAGMYVLLDLHWLDTTRKIDRLPDADTQTLWADLAERYRDKSGLLFDIYNEPHDVSWDQWFDQALPIIDSIRAVHPQSLIFVSGIDWGRDLRGVATRPIPRPNIVYSTHAYP